MTDNLENLILEHLKRIQAEQSASRGDIKEILARLGRMELAIAGLHRNIALTDETSAEQSLRLDRMQERIERIERRLGSVHNQSNPDMPYASAVG